MERCDVACDVGLFPECDVESEVEVVVELLPLCVLAACLLLLLVAGVAFYLFRCPFELEVVDFVCQSEHIVAGVCFVDLYARCAEADVACGLVFSLAREIVVQCHVDSEER